VTRNDELGSDVGVLEDLVESIHAAVSATGNIHVWGSLTDVDETSRTPPRSTCRRRMPLLAAHKGSVVGDDRPVDETLEISSRPGGPYSNG
jgi:hypothetical protein